MEKCILERLRTQEFSAVSTSYVDCATINQTHMLLQDQQKFVYNFSRKACRQYLLLKLSDFKQINELLFPLNHHKTSGFLILGEIEANSLKLG